MTDSIPDEELTPLEELTALLKDQRRRWRKWFVGLTVLLVVLAVGQVRTQHAADKAQAAIDDVVAQRTEARANTCIKDKKFADAHNALVLYLASTKPNPADVRTAEQRAARAALILDFETKNLVPVPDCSPAGIAAFYAGTGGTTTVKPQVPTGQATTAKPAARTITTTTRPSTSTSGTTSTTVYPSSTTPTAPPTTCAVPVTVPNVPCL